MDLINQLLSLVFSPIGLISIVIALFAVTQAKRSPKFAWFLFSLCSFAASIGKFQDEWTPEPPPLVFPLQQLREMGRPLAIVLLVFLLLLGTQTQQGWRRQFLPKAIQYLVVVQVVIFLKTLMFGSPAFAVLAILTFGVVIQMLRLAPSRWIQDNESFRLAVWSIAMVGIIFVVLNAYQAIFDLHAITFVQGRLLGTTGNPLHATTLLAAVIPCFMFLMENSKKWLWKVFWLIGLIAVMYALFLTGSRSGLLMAGVSILFFYRNKSGKLLRLGLMAGILVAVVLPSLGFNPSESVDSQVSDRYLSGENTRATVWEGMWRAFSSYPLFGAPLIGDRLGYGENSWLAVGSTTGLLGFIPMVMFGLECVRMILKLNKFSHQQPTYFLHTSTVIAGLASLLFGSFYEAFLLGNFTFSIISVLTYLLLGQYLLELWETQNQDFASYAEIQPHPFI